MNRPELFLGYESVRGYDGVPKVGDRVDLPADALVRHAFACGASGSGKTVFAKGVVEEAVKAGIPVIAVDLKGDIASLALHGPLTERAALATVFGDDGDGVYREFAEGLAHHRASATGAAAFGGRAQVRLFTPMAPIGHQVAMAGLPSFDPSDDPLEQQEIEQLTATLVRGFAASIYGTERRVKANEPAVKLLEAVVGWCNDRGERLEGCDGIRRVIGLLQAPPFQTLGGLSIEEYVTRRQMQDLVSGLNSRVVGAERVQYDGVRMSVETLLGGVAPGRVPLSIVYLGHISDFLDQSRILAELCADVYRWMRRTGGSERLRLLLYVDELGGGDGAAAFFPSFPHSPPSKPSLNLLVKQGRSAGVGLLLATQNPMSVDVRALTNINTWAIGRLTQRNDHGRIQDVLERMPQGRDRALETVRSLPVGAFLTISDALSTPLEVRERWLYSVHRQLSADQVRRVHQLSEGVEIAPGPKRRVAAEPAPPLSSPTRFTRPLRPTAVSAPETDTSEVVGEEPDETVTFVIENGPSWEVVHGDQRWRVCGGATVGRGPQADIRIDDPHLSRLHLELRPEGDELRVRALKSKNATHLDGRLLQGDAKVEAGQRHRLEIGTLVLELVSDLRSARL
ncbi:MAG: helicase HerA-like domain-containing protein [Myxococcota bacterium]